MTTFPTAYSDILQRIDQLDPRTYSRTRNYLDGSVSRLSPYLTHGVISTRFVGARVLSTYSVKDSESFIRELAWKDYFRLVWDTYGDGIFSDLRHPQPSVESNQVPTALLDARTGISVLDDGLRELLQTGYIHNHLRLWLAMLTCSVGHAHWWEPSKWMYYHLLDGDLASNSLSWQWVAGSFRGSPYIANQENINTFSSTIQRNTFLDTDYETLSAIETPEPLRSRQSVALPCTLPDTPTPLISGDSITLYHPWSLDPTWRVSENATKILLLEPSHFSRHPISKKRLDFILKLASEIPDLQVFTAEFSQLSEIVQGRPLFFRQYPAIKHWVGNAELALPLFVHNNTSTPLSFSAFWKHSRMSVAEGA